MSRKLAGFLFIFMAFSLTLPLCIAAGEAVRLPEPPTPAGSTAISWACAKCHATESWTKLAGKVVFDHDVTGTHLGGAHARAACDGCHKPGQRTGEMPERCLGCHSDPHRGEMPRDCEQCHSATGWSSPRSLPSHEMTRFALTGAHTATQCQQCHTRLGRETHRGTPAICGDCHGNLAYHVRNPDHRLAGFGPDCQPCHSTFAWKPARVNHSTWWPLYGQHAGLDCSKCHGKGIWRGVSGQCLPCHTDKYANSHPNHKTLGIPTTCGDCHTATTWNVLLTGWHDSIFPVTSGSHSHVSCAGCHASGGYADSQLSCTSCHTHSQSSTASRHSNVGAYVWQSSACFHCHRSG